MQSCTLLHIVLLINVNNNIIIIDIVMITIIVVVIVVMVIDINIVDVMKLHVS